MKNDNTPNFFLNYSAIIAELKNETLNKFLLTTIPDEKSRTTIYKMLRGFNARGIESEVVINVLMDAFREE